MVPKRRFWTDEQIMKCGFSIDLKPMKVTNTHSRWNEPFDDSFRITFQGDLSNGFVGVQLTIRPIWQRMKLNVRLVVSERSWIHLGKSFHIVCDVNACLILNKAYKRLEITLHHAFAIHTTSGRNIALFPPTVQALPVGDKMRLQGRIVAFHVMFRISDSMSNTIF